MTSPVSDIPSHVRNAIVGRFLGFKALAPNILTIELDGDLGAAAHLIHELCWLTDKILNDRDSTQAPAELLRNLARRLNDEVCGLDDASRLAAQPVIEELSVLVAEYEETPYDPLKKLTDAAARTAADYYKTFAAVPDELWQSTVPRFSWVNGEIGLSFVSTVHVQLWTEFGDYDYPTAQVVVKIAPRWLDLDTIAALPRSLLHEYVAHVPQGPHSGKRQHPDAGDMFAEGWMDYVAHLIFKEAMQRQEPSLELCVSPDPTWIDLHELAAERFFSARCEISYGDRLAALRYLGVAAARQLHALLRRLPATKGSPDEYLYRLSLGLNASQLSNVARARFAANVQLSMRLGSRSDVLIVPLCEWAAGNISSDEFFERVISY